LRLLLFFLITTNETGVSNTSRIGDFMSYQQKVELLELQVKECIRIIDFLIKDRADVRRNPVTVADSSRDVSVSPVTEEN